MVPFRAALSMSLWLALPLLAVSKPLEIVLAHCKENIDWVDELGYGAVTTVYDKCGDQNGPGNHVTAANVGRESGTYLKHIVDHYDSLADWTVFSQAEKPTYGYHGHRLGGGHLMSNVRFEDYVKAAENKAENPRFFVFTSILLMGRDNIYQSIRHGYGEEYLQPTTKDTKEMMCGTVEDWNQWYEFPDWFKEMVQRLQEEQQAPVTNFDTEETLRVFGVQPTQGITFFAQGARFAASREAIHSRPKSYYESLLKHLNHEDPWAGYFLEWLWYYVLGGVEAPCGQEEAISQGHLVWKGNTKSRNMAAMQIASGQPGEVVATVTNTTVSSQLVLDETATVIVFIKNIVFEVKQIFTQAADFVFKSAEFSGGAEIDAGEQGVAAEKFVFGAASVIKAAAMVVTYLELAVATVTIQATLSMSGGGATLPAGAILAITDAAAAIENCVFQGAGHMRSSGKGKPMQLLDTLFAITLTLEILLDALATRRTDFTTMKPVKACGSALPTTTLSSGTYLLADISTACVVSTATDYSNTVFSLSAPTGSVLLFTGLTTASKPTLIMTWSDIASSQIEIDNVTYTGTFCTDIIHYNRTTNDTACVTSFSPAPIIDSCANGYTCSVSGSAFSDKFCRVQFCQNPTPSSSNNDGLYGLIALVALVPIAAIAGVVAYKALGGGAAAATGAEVAAYNQYYYPEPYAPQYPPQYAAYPQYGAYPQYPQYGAYPTEIQYAPPYGMEGYPFEGGFYDPGLQAPVPTPLGFSTM